jgi:hypothetical protein
MGKVLIDLESVKDKKIHRAWYKLTDEDGNIPVNTSNTTRSQTTSVDGTSNIEHSEPGLSPGASPSLSPSPSKVTLVDPKVDTLAAAGAVLEREGSSGPPNPSTSVVDDGDKDGAHTSANGVAPGLSLSGLNPAADSPSGGDAGTKSTPLIGVDKGLGSIEVILWWRHNEEIAAAVEAVELARAESNKSAGPNPHPHLNIRQDGLTHSVAVPLRRITTDPDGKGGNSKLKSRSRFGFGDNSGSAGTGVAARSETQNADQEPRKGAPGSSLSFNVNAKVRLGVDSLWAT